MTHDDSRMTNGQRWQAAQDWRDAQKFIASVIIILYIAVSALETLIA